jgi:hypothetical protein
MPPELTTPWSATGDALMMKAVLPLALSLVAGTAFACPGEGMPMDAKADVNPSVAATAPAKAQPTKAVAAKKAVKSAVAKQPTPEAKKSIS